MNIRKVLLLTLILSIASFGLTLTGCEKSDHPTGEHPAAEKAVEDAGAAAEEAKTCCGDDPSKCCGSKAAEEAKEAVDEAADKAESAVKEAVSEHPTEHPE